MKKKNNKICVNLGCGSHIMQGNEWVNVDNYVTCNAKNFVQADITHLPFESDTVDYIICDQVLEHVSMKDVPAVLYEIRRVLKKGGRAVIIVPDFREVVGQWLSFDHDQSFDPVVYNYLSEVIYGNQHHDGEYHKTPMTAGYLNYVLNMVGFVDNTLIKYMAHSPVPNYEGVRPYPPEARCRNAQLVAEIVKK